MYGKLKDGVLETTPRVVVVDGKTVCNPTDAELENMGYKKIRHVEKPEDAPEGKEYEFRWTEQEKEIVQEWYLVDHVKTLEEQMQEMQNKVEPAYIVAQSQAQELSYEQAVKAKDLYREWEDLCKESYTAEKKGYIFRYGDRLYKTVQDNFTFQSQWVPGQGTSAIYTQIPEPGEDEGTLENPIPVPEDVTTNAFTYVTGKYYSWKGKVYKCQRQGDEDGKEYSFPNSPDQLLSQYFVLVEGE